MYVISCHMILERDHRPHAGQESHAKLNHFRLLTWLRIVLWLFRVRGLILFAITSNIAGHNSMLNMQRLVCHHSAAAEGRTCCIRTIVTSAVSSRSLLCRSLSDCISLSSRSFLSLPLSLFCCLHPRDCPQKLNRTCCRSQQPPHRFFSVMVVVHQSYLTWCLKPRQTQTSSKVALPVVLVAFLSPPCRGLTGEGSQQQLLHAESLPSLLLNLFSPPDGHQCLPGITHESPFCTMSQFVRITSSGQIHTYDILPQIVTNGE